MRYVGLFSVNSPAAGYFPTEFVATSVIIYECRVPAASEISYKAAASLNELQIHW